MSSKITIKDSASKTHLCMFCREQQLKLSRYLRRKHKDEAIVAEAMALKDGSKAFQRTLLRGDYHHNCYVLALSEGELIVVRNPGSKQRFGDASSFLPCPDYLLFFLRGTSFGVTTSAVSTKQPSPRNGRNCSLKPGFCCPLSQLQQQKWIRNCFRMCLML